MQNVTAENATHFVYCNEGKALFVKEAIFFKETGGLTEDWGKAWVPVIAKTTGDARRLAADIFGVPLSYIHRGEV